MYKHISNYLQHMKSVKTQTANTSPMETGRCEQQTYEFVLKVHAVYLIKI